MANNSTESPLISAEELKGIMHRPDVKIFDLRGKWKGDRSNALKDYNSSHIEGAILLDWTFHFVKGETPIHLAPVTDDKEANASFEQLGISHGDTVVLYDEYHHMLAGRIWWAMRYFGFFNVKILNGGWKNWKAQGLPVSSETVEQPKGTFRVKQNNKLRTSLSSLIEIKDEINLIDGRGAKNYKGLEDDPRSGHIPGAINIPYSDVLDSDTGLFKPKSELRKIFYERLPNFENTDIISSCGAGYSGTVVLIALKIIGIEAPLFDDSFSVWKLDESRPVEKG